MSVLRGDMNGLEAGLVKIDSILKCTCHSSLFEVSFQAPPAGTTDRFAEVVGNFYPTALKRVEQLKKRLTQAETKLKEVVVLESSFWI